MTGPGCCETERAVAPSSGHPSAHEANTPQGPAQSSSSASSKRNTPIVVMCCRAGAAAPASFPSPSRLEPVEEAFVSLLGCLGHLLSRFRSLECTAMRRVVGWRGHAEVP